MGETAEAAGDGGAAAGDGGAGDARKVRRGGGATGPAAQHTAAGRRVRPGRAPATAGALPASRADEEQLPAATEQVRERRARVGGRGGGRAGAARGRQEGRAAAEGDAVVGAHGRAPPRAVPRRAAALRHGAAAPAAAPAAPAAAAAPALAARRLTPPPRTTPLPYHAYIPLSGRSHSPKCTRVPEYYRLANLFIWDSRPRRVTRTRTL